MEGGFWLALKGFGASALSTAYPLLMMCSLARLTFYIGPISNTINPIEDGMMDDIKVVIITGGRCGRASIAAALASLDRVAIVEPDKNPREFALTCPPPLPDVGLVLKSQKSYGPRRKRGKGKYHR